MIKKQDMGNVIKEEEYFKKRLTFPQKNNRQVTLRAIHVSIDGSQETYQITVYNQECVLVTGLLER